MPLTLLVQYNARADDQVLDRCLRLETEVAQIPQLRRQVGQYRRSQTDMEVASREQVGGCDACCRLSHLVTLGQTNRTARRPDKTLQGLSTKAFPDTDTCMHYSLPAPDQVARAHGDRTGRSDVTRRTVLQTRLSDICVSSVQWQDCMWLQ